MLTFAILLNNSLAQDSSIDSLNEALQKQESDLGRYKTLTDLAIAYSDSNYEKSLDYWKKAFNLANKLGKQELVANAYHQIGFSYMKMGEFRLSLENLENAGAIYKYLDSTRSYAGIQNDMGLIYRNWGKYDKALEYYLNALDLYRKIGDIEGIGIALNSIGQIHFYRENYPKAIEFFKEYLEINEVKGNARSVAGASNNIASSYMELGKYNEALEYFLKSLRIYDSLGISIGIAIIQDNIGSLYFKQNFLENALLYHQNALDIFQSLKSVTRVCYSQKNMGLVLLAQGKVERAIDMFQESLNKAKQIGLKDVESDCSKLLSECYVKTNNFQKAYSYLLDHIAIKDSILNSETLQKIEELQARYEMDKKELEISTINSRLKTQRLNLFIAFGFSVLFISLFLFVIIENRKKKRALVNLELLRNHLFRNISQNLCNLQLIKNSHEVEDYFTAWWEAKPKGVDEKSNFFHFSYKNYTFCYYFIAAELNSCCDFINFNIYNIVIEYIKSRGELNEGVLEPLSQYLTDDPIVKSLGKNTIKLLPFILHKKQILTLCPDNMAFRQFGSFIVSHTFQWSNLRPDDIVYIFGTHDDKMALNELRKVVKSIDLMDFSEQNDLALNFIHSPEFKEETFIVGFKV